LSLIGSRVANSFLKRRNAPLGCAQRSLSIISFWRGNEEENPNKAAKKVSCHICYNLDMVIKALTHWLQVVRKIKGDCVDCIN
jgi:hypothetical protein